MVCAPPCFAGDGSAVLAGMAAVPPWHPGLRRLCRLALGYHISPLQGWPTPGAYVVELVNSTTKSQNLSRLYRVYRVSGLHL